MDTCTGTVATASLPPPPSMSSGASTGTDTYTSTGEGRKRRRLSADPFARLAACQATGKIAQFVALIREMTDQAYGTMIRSH